MQLKNREREREETTMQVQLIIRSLFTDCKIMMTMNYFDIGLFYTKNKVTIYKKKMFFAGLTNTMVNNPICENL